MPFNPPIPDSGPPRKRSGGVQSLVQAERLMQIAFVLPCATVIGWGAGWWIDDHFHFHWATIVGVVLGLIAGMVSAIKMALAAGNSPRPRGGK